MRKMKNSGIPWIGEIPDSWTLAKYKHFSKNGMGQTILKEDLDEEGVPVYSATQSDTIFGYIKAPKIMLFKSDFVIPARGNSIGSITIIQDDVATCTQTTIYSKINGINKQFLYFCALGLKSEWFKYDKTAIPQITVNQINNNIVPLPNDFEQRQIANYLAGKVSHIDNIISKTKESIEEYKKYKQSLITETVTKGLNPEVKTKDSGVDWIGEIPESWCVKKLKYMFRIKKKIIGYEGPDILSVTQSGLKVKDISNNDGQMAADYSKYQIVDIGDFVMNHMDLLTGWVDCSKNEGVTSPDYRVFSIMDKDSNSSDYYTYIFQSCYKNRVFYGMGQGVSHLGRWRLQTEKFVNMSIPVPPKSEQTKISIFLDQKCLEIDNLISQKEAFLSELNYYKKSIIYECVTGKREVM